ncbi:MAG: hypothetical protein Q3986_07875 [Akkermansia sp.]|nr:hypothetical protein [Akkermansia sp.]
MKKTLTLFLMAAVALATGFAFTSCTGGDKEESSENVITLEDFRKGKREFHISTFGSISIVPEVSTQQASGSEVDTVYVTGYAEFFKATYDCSFIYRTDELNHEDGEPRMGWLWITFESLAAATDASVMAAIGMDPQGTGWVGGALPIQFNFVTHEAIIMSSSQGTVTINYPDPMGEYLTFNAWLRSTLNANFFVTRRGGM